jgi:hypothetical protein
MNPAKLLAILRDRGLTVTADGDALIVRPRTLLTDALRAAIRAHKCEPRAELPRYRWLILEADGRQREICCLPEMTAAEMAMCYPGQQFMPLPDSAAEAGVTLGQRDAA